MARSRSLYYLLLVAAASASDAWASRSATADTKPSSSTCTRLGRRDALLLLNLQNAYLDERPLSSLSSASSYSLSGWAHERPDGTVVLPRGRLAVDGSAHLIATVNSWLSTREEDGGHASVIALIDYHPPGHCSFCDVDHGGIAPLTPAGLLQYCVMGAQTWSNDGTAGTVHLNDSHRCGDSASIEAYEERLYYQWPYHAVAGTIDARFDPFLNLPNETVVFKLGTPLMEDSHNAFVGARRSSAPAGMHDNQPTASAALDDPRYTLEAELEARGIKRLFIFGLPLDDVVTETIFNALGLGHYEAPISQLLEGSVILVEAGTRKRKTDDYLLAEMGTRSTSDILPDATVAKSAEPRAAIREYCTRDAGTCDAKEGCESIYGLTSRDEYFCSPQRYLRWGKCRGCPTPENSNLICSGAGECITYCTARDPGDASGRSEAAALIRTTHVLICRAMPPHSSPLTYATQPTDSDTHPLKPGPTVKLSVGRERRPFCLGWAHTAILPPALIPTGATSSIRRRR
eukprot:scaffold40016_cov27-Tisochrysis_lutea.AAC.1